MRGVWFSGLHKGVYGAYVGIYAAQGFAGLLFTVEKRAVYFGQGGAGDSQNHEPIMPGNRHRLFVHNAPPPLPF